MTSQVKNHWKIFLKGEWTYTPPTKPGLYPIKSETHRFTPEFISVSEINGRLEYSMTNNKIGASYNLMDIWRGSIWSESIPLNML